jgi:hypothetical protein
VAIARALLQQHVARAVVRVFADVPGGVDLAGGHARRAEHVEHLGHRALLRPGPDGPVEFFHARHAARVVGQRPHRQPRSSRPMVCISRLKMLSPLPAISTKPSLQR